MATLLLLNLNHFLKSPQYIFYCLSSLMPLEYYSSILSLFCIFTWPFSTFNNLSNVLWYFFEFTSLPIWFFLVILCQYDALRHYHYFSSFLPPISHVYQEKSAKLVKLFLLKIMIYNRDYKLKELHGWEGDIKWFYLTHYKNKSESLMINNNGPAA